MNGHGGAVPDSWPDVPDHRSRATGQGADRPASEDLFFAVEEVRDLVDGYAFRLPADDHRAHVALAFVLAQRRAYPSLVFHLECEPERGAMWLEVRGGSEVATMLASKLPRLTPGDEDAEEGAAGCGCGCGCGAPAGACDVALHVGSHDAAGVREAVERVPNG